MNIFMLNIQTNIHRTSDIKVRCQKYIPVSTKKLQHLEGQSMLSCYIIFYLFQSRAYRG